MKQTLLSRLILAGLAGAAMSAAQAGQIQASSVSIAREAITDNTQAVIAPSIAYRFAGDVDARVQAQTFQIQFTLAAGAWGTLPATIAQAISMSDGVSGVIQDQSAVGPVGPANASYQVVATGKSTDSKTLWATVTVNQGAAALVKQPIFSLNVTSNTITGGTTAVATSRAPVTGLFTVAGDIVADYTANGVCTNNNTLAVSFKHYVALTSPNAIATDLNGTADEHTRSGATNQATLITFPTNLKVVLTAATGTISLTAGGNLGFTGTAPAYVSATVANIGSIAVTQNATGYDSNLANQYLLANGGAGVSAIATAAVVNGAVEASNLKLTVSASSGFVVGGSLALSTAANCGALIGGTATVAIAAGNAAGPIDLLVPTAALNAALGATTGTAPVYVCYTAPGAVTIPSSVFTGVGTLVKAANGGTFLGEQNNICKGNYVSLGGGLKIDVRNYASSAETSGYTSVLRFINNSDSVAADVWAQFVHQNGKLGNWAKIAQLPVRGTINMTANQIDAKLAAGSAATQAIGTAAPVAQASVAGISSDTAPRLRITSTTGKSLRVQNYLFNSATGQILEGSGQQGVDYEGGVARAPLNEGQYQDQDANSGLNLAP